MSGSPLSRFAAPIAIVAGVLVVATRLVIMFTMPTDVEGLKAHVLEASFALNSVASVVAFALLIIAVVAAHDRQARAAGIFGAVALGVAIIGTVFMAGDWWYEAFAVPRMAEVAPGAMDTFVGGRLFQGGVASFALLGIGWVLYGIASLRARVYPIRVSAAILVGGLLSGVPIGILYLSGGVVLGLAIVWLGAWLLASPDTELAGVPTAA